MDSDTQAPGLRGEVVVKSAGKAAQHLKQPRTREKRVDTLFKDCESPCCVKQQKDSA